MALIVLAALWAHAVKIAAMGARIRVTALDRAEVVNEEKLRKAFPSLADDIRGALGRWIAEEDRRAAYRLGAIGTVVALVNLVLVWMVRRRRRRPAIEGAAAG